MTTKYLTNEMTVAGTPYHAGFSTSDSTLQSTLVSAGGYLVATAAALSIAAALASTQRAAGHVKNAEGIMHATFLASLDTRVSAIPNDSAATSIDARTSAEISSRTSAVLSLDTRVSSETSSRGSAATSTDSRVSSETSARTSAATSTDSRVSSETSARTSAATSTDTRVSSSVASINARLSAASIA